MELKIFSSNFGTKLPNSITERGNKQAEIKTILQYIFLVLKKKQKKIPISFDDRQNINSYIWEIYETEITA